MNYWRVAAVIGLVLCVSVAGYNLRAQDTKKADPVKVFNTSLALESEGKYAEALRELEKITADHPGDYLVNLRLGWLNYLNRDYGQSAAFYRKALSISADRSIEALLGLTLPLAAREEWADVEELYKRILALDPLHYVANLRLGQIYYNRGSFAEAQPFLDAAVTHYPAEYEANLYAAWNDVSLNKYPAARLLFEHVLMISPGDTSAQRGFELTR